MASACGVVRQRRRGVANVPGGAFPSQPPRPVSKLVSSLLAEHKYAEHVSRRTRPSRRVMGAVSLLQNPMELDGEGLGKAASAAAREGVDDREWWDALARRSKQLVLSIALHDAALVLNGMARMRRLDKELVEELVPRISSYMIYLTSAHLSMIASAVAKSEVYNAQFVGALTRELKARLMEFQTMEITMMLNAATKVRITDADLYKRFVTHINHSTHVFHVRDLSVIATALARVNCLGSDVAGRLADSAMLTIPECTPAELSKLMECCMRVNYIDEAFYSTCVLHCRSKLGGMDPAALAATAFAFGQCLEAAAIAHLPCIRRIFRFIRLALVANLPMAQPADLVSILRTYARWQISFDVDHVRKVADRMTSLRDQFNLQGSVSALYSLAILMQRNAWWSNNPATVSLAWESAGEAGYFILGSLWRSMQAESELDFQTLLRAVEASNILLPGDSTYVFAVGAWMVQHHTKLDGPNCAAMYDRLSQSCQPDDDIMLFLSERMSPKLM
uniref:RNA-editing substrate-binding complex 6 protein domain-containing protein n=1 Tax=Noctiluca scintillans TaxID=2966 RepID=A0A7S1B3L8_NOCSC